MYRNTYPKRLFVVSVVLAACLAAPVSAAGLGQSANRSIRQTLECLINTVQTYFHRLDLVPLRQGSGAEPVAEAPRASGSSRGKAETQGERVIGSDQPGDPPSRMPMILDPNG